MKRSWLAIALLMAASGCGDGAGGGTSSGTPPTNPSDPDPGTPTVTAADLEFCVAETNRLRALVGVPPLTRVAELDAYTALAAAADGASCTPHGYAQSTFFGNGLARAENELLCGSGQQAQSMIASGFAAMFAEGPGGGHYDNTVALYTETGCGAVFTPRGFTLVQAFR